MENSVFRVNPDGENSAPILVTHNDGLISMSFDWMSKQLYYLDNIRNALEVVKVSDQVKKHFFENDKIFIFRVLSILIN